MDQNEMLGELQYPAQPTWAPSAKDLEWFLGLLTGHLLNYGHQENEDSYQIYNPRYLWIWNIFVLELK